MEVAYSVMSSSLGSYIIVDRQFSHALSHLFVLSVEHSYDFSDDDVVERWAENHYWQFFC